MSAPLLPPFEWVESPPDSSLTTGPKQYDWLAFVGFLMAHPGRWVAVTADISQPSVVSGRLGKYGAEALVRGGRIYARFPAQQEAAA